MTASYSVLTAEFLDVHDRDRYLASLILAEPQRAAVQALWAFSADIASVRERISEPAPGEIRLQWWADAISGEGHGNVRQNPVAAAVLDAVETYGLPTGPLQRLISARRFDLYDDPMPDMETFEGYAGETTSVLYQYAAIILNGGEPVEPGDAAGHLGVAHGLVGHLRAFGFNASRGRLFLPLPVFTANGITEAEIFSGRNPEAAARAAAQFSDYAADHLTKARTALTALPRRLRPAFAILPVVEAQLARVRRSLADPYRIDTQLPDWRKIASMLWWAWRNG